MSTYRYRAQTEDTRPFREGEREGKRLAAIYIDRGMTREEAELQAPYDVEISAYVLEHDDDEVHSLHGMGLAYGIGEAYQAAGLEYGESR